MKGYNMHLIFCFLLVLLSNKVVLGQWKFQWKIPLVEGAIWDVDAGERLVTAERQLLVQYDSVGKQRLSQSIKSIGTISGISLENRLKIAVLSEEQQQVCFLDNTLSLQSACLDLSENGVVQAQFMAQSNQTDRLWIFDQSNSQLRLITLRNQQEQLVQNLRGLLDIGDVRLMTEYNNQLVILAGDKRILVFDNFGSLVQQLDLEIATPWMQPWKDGFLVIRGDELVHVTRDGDKEHIQLPIIEVKEKANQFKLVGNRLFISTTHDIYNYEFKIM